MKSSSNITKKEIADEIASRTGLTQIDVKLVMECFLDSIASALIEGRKIEIRGFGRFKVRERKARMARNPQTGAPIPVEAAIVPVFEPSRELKHHVNQSLNRSGQNERERQN